MTLRTLRYTHPNLCPGKTVDRNEIPVKRRITKKTTTTNNDNIENNNIENKKHNNIIDIPEEVLINHIQKVRENRKKEKQDKIKKLISQIV